MDPKEGARYVNYRRIRAKDNFSNDLAPTDMPGLLNLAISGSSKADRVEYTI
jgi:hypothetical protein